MLRKFLFSAAATVAFCSSKAQDSTASQPRFALSGYVDAYYRFNFSNPSQATESFNNFTSFTNSQNSFEPGMVSVKLEHNTGRVGLVADVGFGKRAEEFSYADDATRFAVKQAYVTYSPVASLRLTAGSWATHVGYELVDPYLNRNYSMSYLFSYGPFSHTGLKADFTVGKSSFMVGIANPSDLKSADFSRKFFIAQYSLSAVDDKVKAFINYQGGKPADGARMNQFDLTVTGAVTDKFSMGYNASVQSVKAKDLTGKFGDASSWWGSALYLNIDPSEAFGLTLRSEYFSNKKAVAAAPAASVFANTLSANVRISGALTFIPELRFESADKAIYVKGDQPNAKESTATALVAAVYKF